MNKKRNLENMVHALYAAIGADDWQGMAMADREVAGILSALSAQEAGMAGDLPALEKLRNTHRQAQDHCARQLEKTGRHLEELREHKEGWIAYALGNNMEEANT